jgi:hypothetical protein
MEKRRAALDHEHELRMRKMGLRKETPVEEEYFDEPRYRGSRSSSGRGIWYVAGGAIIILVFALTFVFAGATVHVTPRQGTVELSGPIIAEKESKTGLPFQMLVLEGDKSVPIAAGTTHYVEKKATGTVRFFNNHSTAPQKLLIDTRLSSPDGKIYKTKTAITVPGQKVVSGKTVPGTTDVAIYADVAGEEYNAPALDFKIVGFKGSPKYNDIYAKSITEITGGMKGDTTDVSDEDAASHISALKDALRESLLEKARAQLPEGFIMYDEMAMVSYSAPQAMTTDAGESQLTMHGTINAVIFKETELTKALVASVVAQADQDKVRITNIKDLHIILDPASAIGDPATMEDIKITIDDSMNVVWLVDDTVLQDALAGIKKRDFETKMLQFKNIDKAELSLKPFWKMTLPQKTSAIKIVNDLNAPQ